MPAGSSAGLPYVVGIALWISSTDSLDVFERALFLRRKLDFMELIIFRFDSAA